MDKSRAKGAVINDIYKAITYPSHWTVVLGKTCALVDAKSATLLYRDNESLQAGVFHTFNHAPEVMQEYVEYYCKFDPTFDLAAQYARLGEPISDRQMALSHADFREICGPEFCSFLDRQDNKYLCGAILFDSDHQMSGVSFQKSSKQGAWTDAQLEDLTDVMPHFQRALMIHREFSRLRIKEEVMQAGIDKLYMGFILFDEFLQPVYCNPIAEWVLNHHDAMSLNGDELQAFFEDDTRSIRHGLQRAISSVEANAWSLEHVTVLGLESPGNPPLPLMIVPVAQSTMVPMRRFQHARVAMLFSDPARNQPVIPEALQCAYGLTEAEAAVAISIANGLGVPEVAKLRGTTSNTVRSHMKSIYCKLNVSRQAELAKTILNGPFRVSF